MTKINIPVMISDNDGNPILEIGSGELANNSVTIKFKNNNIPAMAIQRILERGDILGLVFVQLEDEEATDNNSEEKK